MPFHPQKCFTPTLGGKTKRVLVGIIALSSLKSLSNISWSQKEGMWLCKIKVLKKEEKKDKCPRKKEE